MIPSASLANILIVDADGDVGDLLRLNLHSEGFAVELTDCPTVIDLTPYRLMVVDISDLELGCNTIRVVKRHYPDLAIIYCSEHCRGAAVPAALDAGADDCLSKPFSLREMLARIRALMRRSTSAEPQSLELGSLRLDLEARTASTPEGDILLSVTELALLELLMRATDYLSRADILRTLWPDSDGANPRVVDTNISRLRRKLAPAHLTITNRSGIGYRLQPTTH